MTNTEAKRYFVSIGEDGQPRTLESPDGAFVMAHTYEKLAAALREREAELEKARKELAQPPAIPSAFLIEDGKRAQREFDLRGQLAAFLALAREARKRTSNTRTIRDAAAEWHLLVRIAAHAPTEGQAYADDFHRVALADPPTEGQADEK